MTEITINFKTENAAFDEAPELETARILHDLADQIAQQGISEYLLFDINGNNVGGVEITD